MTTYAYDTSTNHLVAVWDTGIGATARTVARLNARTGVAVAMNLAEALTRMSSSVWLTYTESELVDLPVAAVRRALRRPNLPQDDPLRVDEQRSGRSGCSRIGWGRSGRRSSERASREPTLRPFGRYRPSSKRSWDRPAACPAGRAASH
jgi:hypothetical protein